jgi:uncharacterized membrane protein YciS (DUF1049 family)
LLLEFLKASSNPEAICKAGKKDPWRLVMAQVKAIILILVGLVIIVAVVQNNQAMSTSLTFRFNPLLVSEWEAAGVSVYQVTIIAFLLGILIVGFFGLLERFRLKRRIKTLSRELESKERELKSFRNLAITSDQPGTGDNEGV